MRTFVVDDDPVLREMTAELVERHLGGEVEQFADGVELVGAMVRAPDVVLLDVRMPRMDGIAACRLLRANGYDDTHVIFFSGSDDAATRAAAYAAGGDDFVAKQNFGEDVLAKLRTVARKAERRAEACAAMEVSRRAALDAMVAMADMQVVMGFLRVASSCEDCGHLAEAAGRAMQALGIAGQLALWDGADEHFFMIGDRGVVRQPEPVLMPHADASGNRHAAVVITTRVTLVVTAFSGREDRDDFLREHAETLAEAMDARLSILEARVLQGHRLSRPCGGRSGDSPASLSAV